MKKSIILSVFISSLFGTNAQNRPLDTIYANETKTVSLFFPEPIRQGMTGAANYAFSYNREKEQYFGLLQATPGEESNLLVVSSTGQIYSYIVRYAEKVEKLNYFIDGAESIGNERSGRAPIVNIMDTSAIMDSLPQIKNVPDYAKLCGQLLRNPRPFDQIRQNDGITVRMTKSIYYRDDVYIVFEIRNDSQIDFDIDGLNLFMVNGNKKRKASYQELLLPSVFRYNMPKTVPKGSKIQLVTVYPKFTMGKNERLLVKLDEANGSRDIVLKLKLK